MRYNFKSSLKQGQAGEESFHSKHRPLWTRSDGKIEDFRMPDGKLVELKTEKRTTAQTPNLALELQSSPGRQGAIERAMHDGIHYIVYYFADEKYFAYEPEPLLRYMLENKDKHRQVKVQNYGYESTVLLVPREAVKHLEVNLD